jgi:magnesium transporter
MFMEIRTKKIGDFTWVNVSNPEQETLENLLTEQGITKTLSTSLLSPFPRAHVEVLPEAIYLALHFPVKIDGALHQAEVDFLIKKDWLLTVHYGRADFLNEFVDNLETLAISERGMKQSHGGAYFAHFVNYIYKKLGTYLDETASEIAQIEKSIFSGDERKTIQEISLTRRKLFDFESAIRFHKEILESFAASGLSFFGRDYASYGEMIVNSYFSLWHTIEHQKNMLLELKDTNDFLINNKTNELIKSFTAISYIILPLTLVSGFLGMNTILPSTISQNPYGVVYIFIFMIFTGLLIALYLHFKKWL